MTITGSLLVSIATVKAFSNRTFLWGQKLAQNLRFREKLGHNVKVRCPQKVHPCTKRRHLTY